jgi:tRNA A37 methylthiotransferase MiaB
MNERDSHQVAKMLKDRGYMMTTEQAEADVILINTCSVRDMAEQKALNKMSSMQHLRKTRPHIVYGFMGCMAQSRGKELLERGADLVVGTQNIIESLITWKKFLEPELRREWMTCALRLWILKKRLIPRIQFGTGQLLKVQ